VSHRSVISTVTTSGFGTPRAASHSSTHPRPPSAATLIDPSQMALFAVTTARPLLAPRRSAAPGPRHTKNVSAVRCSSGTNIPIPADENGKALRRRELFAGIAAGAVALTIGGVPLASEAAAALGDFASLRGDVIEFMKIGFVTREDILRPQRNVNLVIHQQSSHPPHSVPVLSTLSTTQSGPPLAATSSISRI